MDSLRETSGREPRTLRIVAAMALVGALATSCSSGDRDAASGTSTVSSAAASGPWTFVDDRGVTVTADTTPTTIAAQEDAANALAHFGVDVAGVFGGAPLADNPQLEDVDVSGIESLGDVWGEVNLEKTATLAPDLIVTLVYEPDPGPSTLLWGFNTKAMQRNAESLAPIVAIDANKPATEVIARFEELATSLGVDMSSPEMAEARSRFETAVQDLQAAAQAAPDLDVMVVAGEADTMSVAVPAAYQDLQDYVRWGVNLVQPTDPDNAYFETLSWEQADRYPADVILYDSRSYVLSPDELAKIPTWARLPAVEADQIAPWKVVGSTSYQLYADHIEELTALLQSSQDVA